MSIGLYGILEEVFDRTLTEAQQVVIDFKGIFGADTYEAFKDVKRRLGSPENDISYWVRRYREEGEPVIGEMSRLVGGETSLTKRDVEGRRIPEPEETKELVASNDCYDVYNVTDVGDMIDLAMRKVAGHAGAYWCIAGRYNLYDYDVDRDDAVKVSQAEEFFGRYLDGDYFAYFVCMPKDGDHQKYCICATGPSSADVWSSDDRREVDDDARDIPAFEAAGFSYEGIDDLDYDSDDEPDDDEEPEDEGPHQWQDEDGLIHMGERPADPVDPEMISVEDPNSMEFRAGSKEEAIAAFADSGVVSGVEFVEDIPNTPVCIVKFMVEPEHEEFPQEGDDVYVRDLPGDRYTAFIFFPGEGGGPLLTQDGKIIANRTIEGAKRPFVRDFDQGSVFHQGQEPARPEQDDERSEGGEQ
jgi:hypothetical protein